MKFNFFPMKIALEEARLCLEKQEVPVGAVLYDPFAQRVIDQSGNCMKKTMNCLDHAEMCILLRRQSDFLSSYDLYVTLEPCVFCIAALIKVRIRRIFFGAYNIKGGGIDHTCQVLDALGDSAPFVIGGVCEQECSLLLQEFFSERRSKAYHF